MQTILALAPLPPDEMAVLEQNFQVIRLWREKDPEATLQAHRNDILGMVTAAGMQVPVHLIESLPNLEIISQFGVGVDNLDLKLAKARHLVVTNTPDVLTDETADTAIALMLAVARRICEADMYVRVGKWLNGPMPLGISIGGKTAGIVGLGRIGHAIARRCEAFNMKVVYHGPHKKDGVPYDYYADLNDMAAACDMLLLSCRGGPETKDIVNYRVLESLGKRGVLVNVARGSVVKQDDLLQALSNRVIAGAGLDVYWDEPRVPESLISMDNVVLLPHIGSATTETRSLMGRLVVDNLLAHFGGMPVKTLVQL